MKASLFGLDQAVYQSTGKPLFVLVKNDRCIQLIEKRSLTGWVD
jgi:hypothetical protein